jgi:hypothetical protein
MLIATTRKGATLTYRNHNSVNSNGLDGSSSSGQRHNKH